MPVCVLLSLLDDDALQQKLSQVQLFSPAPLLHRRTVPIKMNEREAAEVGLNVDASSGNLSKLQTFYTTFSLRFCAELQWRNSNAKREFCTKKTVTLEDTRLICITKTAKP